ncbi:MAG: hypothetical protein K9K64_01960 [Desulfohalobiaceae bacterium]|nr:hypothetical protein [Desulfohalobiaceae bacterium]
MTSLRQKDLQELIARRNQEEPIISLYLNLSRPQQRSTEVNSMLHTSLQKVKSDDRFSREQQKSLQDLSRKIDAAFHGGKIRLEPRSRTLALFVGTDGFWKEVQFPVIVSHSQVHVSFSPYTRPLTALKNVFTRYAVLVTDSRQARIFTLFMGDIENRHDHFVKDEVPDRVRAKASLASGGGRVMGASGGGEPVTSGIGDQKIQRHIQDHVQHHLRNAAEKALYVCKDSGFERLILASTEDYLISSLRNHLHSYLQQRYIAAFKADPEEHTDKLRKKALGVIRTWEQEQEEQTVNRILEENHAAGLAVLGTEPVLEALGFGQVHTLVLENDLKLGGYVCDQDGTLSTYLEKCPACSQNMRKTEDLTEEMIEEAVAQGAEVEHVSRSHEEFATYGIGALLRFKV